MRYPTASPVRSAFRRTAAALLLIAGPAAAQLPPVGVSPAGAQRFDEVDPGVDHRLP